MAHVGSKHINTYTGLSCDCPWGGTTGDQRLASQQVRKLRNQNQKIFRDVKGQAFLDRLEKLLDAHPEADAMAPWFAQQYKQGNLKPAESYNPQGYMAGIETAQNADIWMTFPRWAQWFAARNHPLRQGKNIMEMDTSQLTLLSQQLADDVAEKQEAKNWVANYGEYASNDPKHIFGPEAGKYQGWQVHQIRDAHDAEAETAALGHCIGQDEQPYKHNIDQGVINAWSLRDQNGFPKVSWHHNPDGTLAHIQGRSGYPDAERRDLISQFNKQQGMHDDNGGAGHDDQGQLEHANMAEPDVQLPEIDSIEEFMDQFGSNFQEYAYDYAYHSGLETDEWTEYHQGDINWDWIKREMRQMIPNGFDVDEDGDPEGLSYQERDELESFIDLVRSVGSELQLQNAINDDPSLMALYEYFANGGYMDDESWVSPEKEQRAWADNEQWDADKAEADRRQKMLQWPAPQPVHLGPPKPTPPGQVTLFSGRRWGKTAQLANILDPIHETLDPTVFDHPNTSDPKLKPKHRKWIKDAVVRVLDDAGYDGMEDWLQLVFTGSLCTYQYSDDSDVDVSLFINAERLPEWSRAELIGLMVGNIDGTKLPGTTHVMQVFVIPHDVDVTDLYKPGLRSGYDLENDTWIIPPERDRVHDVAAEMNSAYVHALEQADKMDRLLRYEPDKAIQLWHQIHKRRQRDQRAGKGDFSDSNITYKMLANRGLFPRISDYSGEYIAKTALGPAQPTEWAWEQANQPPPEEMRLNQKGCAYCGATLNPTDTRCPQCLNANSPVTTGPGQSLNPIQPVQPVVAQPQVAPGGALPAQQASVLPEEAQIQAAAQQLGLQHPVRVVPTYNKRGGYGGLTRDPYSGGQSHLLYVNPEQHPGARNWALWHELGHAKRIEDGGEFTPNDELSQEDYENSPNEQHAEGIANQHADWDLWGNE